MQIPMLSRLLRAQKRAGLDWAAHSVRGARDENEDAVVTTARDQTGLVEKRGVLLIVCDGIGGATGGAIASEVAASTAMRVFYACDMPDEEDAIRAAIGAANTAVREQAERSALYDMGTTIVMAAVTRTRCVVGHVGDSRAYLFEPGRGLRQLTADHAGDWGLTRSLGAIGDSEAETITAQFLPGARLLLCTDGLYRALTETELQRELRANPPAEAIAERLAALAYANCSRDNITAAVVVNGVGRTLLSTGHYRALYLCK